MTKVALRGIRSHLGRFLLSILAVLLGVAFVAGTFSLRAMMSDTFDEIVQSGTDADTYVEGLEMDLGGNDLTQGATTERFPLEVADAVAAVPGVSGVVPDVSGPIVLVGADGTAVLSSGPPSFGMALYPGERAVDVVAGRVPSAPDEIVLESSALERSGLALGDRTTVVVGGELRGVEVVGEVGFAAPMAGAIMVGFDVDTARELYAPDGATSLLAVYGDEGVSQSALADAVESALAGTDADGVTRVLTGDQMRDEAAAEWKSMLGFVSTFLLVFAGIALFVGTFIISNTFAMVVRQRQREFAMLRAIGAAPSQVFASVLGQAAVIGVLGSALGVGAGLGLVEILRQVFAGMGMEWSGDIPLDSSTVVVSVVVGTLVSLVAALVPARRAALTAPVEAMRTDVSRNDRAAAVRAGVGAVLLALGVGLVAAATTGVVEDGAGSVLGLGAVATVLAVLALAPTIVPGALGVLASPFVAGVKPLGGLARGNVTRNPKRTATTASALMIGMALVGAASVIAASAQASVRDVIDNQTKVDLLLQSATWDVPAGIVDDVAALEGVDRVDTLRISGPASVEGVGTAVIGVPEGFFVETLTVPEDSGSVDALAAGTAVVQSATAKDHGWAVGDVLTVTGSGGTRELEVGAIIDSGAMGLPVVIADADFDAVVAPTDFVTDSVFLSVAAGVDLADVRAEITELVRPYVVVSVMDAEEYGDAVAAQVDQMLVILYAMLGLSIVIAVLGIVNTLALSISERTREIGLLRAVGLGRLQLASVVTIESVLTALFGTVLGIGVGAGLASTMTVVFEDEGFTNLAVPWDGLGVLLGLAVVVGVVAAVWPAARAARMDVLEAIAYE